MDKIKAMEAFIRVVETGGFTKAADSLQAPKATVSTLVQELEALLGVKLLHRTTRRVTVTADGAAFYERCVRILEDVREAEESVSAGHSAPSGRLRVDVATAMASHMLIPRLDDFMRRYPDIRMELGCSDRPINLLSEGVDCAVRSGEIIDSSTVSRRLGSMNFVTCAAPSYLSAHGVPQHPDELFQHRCLNYFFSHTGRLAPWDFNREGDLREVTFDSPLALNDSNSYIDACLSGLGIGQLPCFVFHGYAQRGELVEILDQWRCEPTPISVVYPTARHLSTKVRVFVEWMVEVFEGQPELTPP